jgi:VWFA-related protein
MVNRLALRTALAAALSFLAAASPLASASGQQAAASPQGKSLRATSVAVEIYAIVEGRRGRLIRDLNKDDFELTEDGTPQKITYFSRETNAALSLGLAIDTSVSQGRMLATEQAAAKEFLRSVLRTGDQAFVMDFDVDVKLLQDFTGTASELARAVDSAEINQTGRSVLQEGASRSTGGTHLYDTVYLASNELMKQRLGRKVLVLVTDGEDQGSRSSLRESIESAEKANVIVYSIIVSDPDFYALLGGSYHGDASARKLVRETGGRTIRVKSIEQIGQAFDEIAAELRAQYLLGYFPSNPRHDGSFRRIRVSVRGRNDTVRTRTGYYDRGEEEAEAKGSSQGTRTGP